MGSIENDNFAEYDGSFSDTYEENQPKKRGRKKKTEKKENSKQKEEKLEVPDENEELIDALINDENADIDDGMLDDAFAQYSPGIDLACDTTGTINKLRTKLPRNVTEVSNGNEQSASEFVIKWCNKMMQKDEYTDDERDAFDAIMELVARLGMENE